MSIPPLPMFHHKPDSNRKKANYIVRTLYGKTKKIIDEADAIAYIEKIGLENFDFDYPYGSFEEFKKHAIVGDFKVPEIPKLTEKQQVELEQAVQEGKLWVKY